MENKLKELKKEIIKILPEIECRNTSVQIPKPFSGLINFRDKNINLDHVLIVLDKIESDVGYCESKGGFIQCIDHEHNYLFEEYMKEDEKTDLDETGGDYFWKTGSLDNQSKILIEILHRIICKK